MLRELGEAREEALSERKAADAMRQQVAFARAQVQARDEQRATMERRLHLARESVQVQLAMLEEADSLSSKLPVAQLGCTGGSETAAPPVTRGALRVIEEGRTAFAMPLTCVRCRVCRWRRCWRSCSSRRMSGRRRRNFLHARS